VFVRNTYQLAIPSHIRSAPFQRKGTSPIDRENTIRRVLGRTAQKVTDQQAEDLKRKLTREDVAEALKLSANDRAPGEHGIMYEIWKTLDSRFITLEKEGKPAFDILEALHMVYNDIQTHGMMKNTGFLESWMAPFYKKNDHTDIANYRPISVLNTDYKIMTKALTIKLARAAPSLIHPVQAGFIPGCHVYDQIWLTKRVIDLAEATEIHGVIVALNQEKAYVKIEHD
jgi:hypothetical protein